MKEILKFAIIGIRAEIDRREKTIVKGRQFIVQIERGEKAKTKLTISEIQEIIAKNKREIEELDRKRFDYEWQLSMSESSRIASNQFNDKL